MARYLVAFLALFIFITASPALAKEGESSDPNHAGYEYEQENPSNFTGVKWTPYQTKCAACRPLADSYNSVMDSLFEIRYMIVSIEDGVHRLEGSNRMKRDGSNIKKKATDEGLSAKDEQNAAAQASLAMALAELGEKLPDLRQQQRRLEAMATDLYNQLAACERDKCNITDPPGEALKVGNGAGAAVETPLDWKGPYPEVCNKCAKLAARLNELPDLATKELAVLEAAKAQKAVLEARILQARAFHDSTSRDGERWQKDRTEQTEAYIKEYEEKLAKEQQKIDLHQHNLDEIKRNFDQTLALYNKCVPTCPKAVEDKHARMIIPGGDTGGGNCQYASLPDRFVIGPNGQFGSGAAMKDKVKNTATGMAMGALGGFGGSHSMGSHGGDAMTGGGIGREGIMGGGGSDNKGPPTDKDPTSGKWDKVILGDYGMDYRFIGTADNGLTISTKIDDAPGDGTFHAVFLQDGSGKTIAPRKYWIYSLYQDWKLTVWWTYDHWTDGVHDDHDEGREVTTGRNNLGTWKVYEGSENGIWSEMGFGNASKGIRTLGTDYDLSKLNLSCPLRLTTYVTEPKADPVTARPVQVTLGRTKVPNTKDEILWNVIRNSAGSLDHDQYQDFMDGVAGH